MHSRFSYAKFDRQNSNHSLLQKASDLKSSLKLK